MESTKSNVVHCKRSKYDVYVGRPGPWGNPFIEGQDGDRETVIELYKIWINEQPDLIIKIKRELKSKILGCWCSPKPCHGDILAEIANEPD